MDLEARFQLGDSLGRDELGQVFRATEKASGRRAAVKVFDDWTLQDEKGRIAFREALERLRRIRPARTPPVASLHLEEADGWMVTRFVEGLSLADHLGERGTIDVEEAAAIVCGVLDSLDELHSAGSAHGGISPGKILLIDGHGPGSVVITDPFQHRLYEVVDPVKTSRNDPDRFVGLPHYFSPEQAQGKTPDVRSDLYVVGLLFYEMLTGKTPFDASQPSTILKRQIYERPLPLKLARPGLQVSQDVETIISTALSKDPEQRFLSARAFRRAVNNLRASVSEDDERRAAPMGISPAGVLIDEAVPDEAQGDVLDHEDGVSSGSGGAADAAGDEADGVDSREVATESESGADTDGADGASRDDEEDSENAETDDASASEVDASHEDAEQSVAAESEPVDSEESEAAEDADSDEIDKERPSGDDEAPADDEAQLAVGDNEPSESQDKSDGDDSGVSGQAEDVPASEDEAPAEGGSDATEASSDATGSDAEREDSDGDEGAQDTDSSDETASVDEPQTAETGNDDDSSSEGSDDESDDEDEDEDEDGEGSGAATEPSSKRSRRKKKRDRKRKKKRGSKAPPAKKPAQDTESGDSSKTAESADSSAPKVEERRGSGEAEVAPGRESKDEGPSIVVDDEIADDTEVTERPIDVDDDDELGWFALSNDHEALLEQEAKFETEPDESKQNTRYFVLGMVALLVVGIVSVIVFSNSVGEDEEEEEESGEEANVWPGSESVNNAPDPSAPESSAENQDEPVVTDEATEPDAGEVAAIEVEPDAVDELDADAELDAASDAEELDASDPDVSDNDAVAEVDAPTEASPDAETVVAAVTPDSGTVPPVQEPDAAASTPPENTQDASAPEEAPEEQAPEVDNSAQALELLSQAQAALASRDLGGAQSLFEQTIALDNSLSAAHAGLGDVYFEQRNYSQASRYHRQATQLSGRAEYHRALGMDYFRLNNYESALTAFEAAVARGDGDAQRYVDIVRERMAEASGTPE